MDFQSGIFRFIRLWPRKAVIKMSIVHVITAKAWWGGRGLEDRGESGQCIVSFPATDMPPHGLWSAMCRFCCKSLFALVIKISFGCTRDFRVKIWGTSSPEDKLAGDLANVIEAISIDDCGSDCLAAGKLGPGHLRFFS